MAQKPPKKRPTPQVVSLSKETLNSLAPALDSMVKSLDQTNTHLNSIHSTLFNFMSNQAEQRKDAVRNEKLGETAQKGFFAKFFSTKEKPVRGLADSEGTTIRGGVSRGVEKGIGGGLGLFMKLAGAGVGLAALGAGIGGFIGGLAVADAAARKLGTGEHLVSLMGNLATGLSKFNLSNGAALAGLLGTGALFGAFGGAKKSGLAAVGMTAIGLGIGGFIGGLAASSTAIDAMNLDLSNFPTQAENVGKGLEAFAGSMSGDTAKVLGGMLAAGGLFAAFGGLGGAFKMAVGMTAIGAGIGGFVGGIAAGGGLAELAGFDGAGFKTVATNIAEGLSAFSDGQLLGLTGLFAAGAIFGAVPGGVAVAGLAAVGATAIGLGLGGFISGIAMGGGLASLVGADGSGLKSIMINIADGLKGFNGIDGSNFASLGLGMAGLGAGMATMLISLGAAKVAEGLTNMKNMIVSFFTGKEAQQAKGPFEGLKEMLAPIESIDFTTINAIDGAAFQNTMTGISNGLSAFSSAQFGAAFKGVGIAIANFLSGGKNPEDNMFTQIQGIADNSEGLTKGANALERIAIAMTKFSGIKFNSNDLDFEGMAIKLGQSIPLLQGLTKGGKVGEGYFDGPEIDFGKGLIDNPDIDLDGLAIAMGKVNEILGTSQGSVATQASTRLRGGPTGSNDTSNVQVVNSGGNVNKGGDNTVINKSTTNNFAAATPANGALVATATA